MESIIRDTQVQTLWISGRRYRQQKEISPHQHDFYQLQYILSGKEKLQINGINCTATKNNVILFKKNTLHGYKFLESTKVLDIKFSMIPEFESFLQEILTTSPVKITDEYVIENSRLLLGLATTFNNTDDNTLVEIDTRLKLLLLQILRTKRCYSPALVNDIGESQTLKNSKANDMIKFIKTNYTKPLDLKILKQEFHYSEQNIIKIFKENTQLTPNNFIQKVKLEKALKLLEESEYQIQEIAEKIGFSPNYFTKIFYKNFGYRPIDYRKKYKNHRQETIILSKEFDAKTQPKS